MSDRLQSVGLLNPDWSIWGSVVTQEQMDIGYWINRTMSYTALMSVADEEKTVVNWSGGVTSSTIVSPYTCDLPTSTEGLPVLSEHGRFATA